MDLIGRKFPPKEAFVVEATVLFTGMGIGEFTEARMDFKTIVDIENSRVKSDSATSFSHMGLDTTCSPPLLTTTASA